jgi:hypothetical protein
VGRCRSWWLTSKVWSKSIDIRVSLIDPLLEACAPLSDGRVAMPLPRAASRFTLAISSRTKMGFGEVVLQSPQLGSFPRDLFGSSIGLAS